MNDHDPRKERAASVLGAAMMDTHRPLDALLPSLKARPERLPKRDLHPRVLQTRRDNHDQWVFILWRDPGRVHLLHAALRELVEATLLAELSRPGRDLVADPDRHFDRMVLLVVEPLGFDPAPALAPFGFLTEERSPELSAESLRVLRGEAERAGHALPDRVHAMYAAEIRHLEGERGEVLKRLHGELAIALSEEVWGQNPSVPSFLFAHLVRERLGATIRPTLDGVRGFETLVVQQTPGVIRWIDPLVFQALCDHLPVVAAAELGAELDWAECAEAEPGLYQPPLLRVRPPEGAPVYVPIGEHVLRWCIMPVTEGEHIPSLAEWLVDQFQTH